MRHSKLVSFLIIISVFVLAGFDSPYDAEKLPPIPYPHIFESEFTTPYINVITPSSLDFTIDLFNSTGQGQIFSGVHLLQNMGSNEANFIITNYSVSFVNEEGDTVPVTDEMHIVIDFGRADTAPLVLTAGGEVVPHTIFLQSKGFEQSSAYLRVLGSINFSVGQVVDWLQYCEVRITISYTIEALATQSFFVADEIEHNDEQYLVVEYCEYEYCEYDYIYGEYNDKYADYYYCTYEVTEPENDYKGQDQDYDSDYDYVYINDCDYTDDNYNYTYDYGYGDSDYNGEAEAPPMEPYDYAEGVLEYFDISQAYDTVPLDNIYYHHQEGGLQ